MAKLVRYTTKLILIIYFLLPCIPYATSYKILSKRDLLGSGNTGSSGCPFAQLGNTIDSLLNSVCGILGATFLNIEAPLLSHDEQLRPEPGYYFQEPDTTANPPDQRGPCPGLNLLANYGYLPRNGIVTLQQVVEATARGFNMGVDLSTVLAVFAIVTTGNITTQTFSLGGPDPRVGVGNIGGLNRHNTVECDISPNREDYYTGNCDDHHLSSRMFKQNFGFARNHGGLFTLDAMTDQYVQNADYSKTNNPYLFYSLQSAIVSIGAHMFYPYFFSNGTYEYDGKPDYISISYIVGANMTINGNVYDFKYIPERWPEVTNAAGKPWYRRSTPFNLINLLTLLPGIYLKNPVGIPFGQLGTSNFNPQTLACDIYSTLIQLTPTFLAQPEQDLLDSITWVISILDPVFTGTTFGCPPSSFSSNGGNSNNNQPGTYNDPETATCLYAGPNDYDQIYFPTTSK